MTPNTFSQIPHGIVDAPINNTLKMIIWFLYDNADTYTHSASNVAHRLQLTEDVSVSGSVFYVIVK